MRRGTTPTITYSLPFDTVSVQAAEITFSCPGSAYISKSLPEMTASGNKLAVRLTQEETLRFRDGSTVSIQIALRLAGGSCVRSKIHQEPVTDALKGVPI